MQKDQQTLLIRILSESSTNCKNGALDVSVHYNAHDFLKKNVSLFVQKYGRNVAVFSS